MKQKLTAQEKKNLKLAEKDIGKSIQTGWGPSVVVGVDLDAKVVNLLEFGEEPYCVDLSTYHEINM